MIARLVENNDAIRYVGYGVEIGESGTPHLQGVLSLSLGQSLSRVKKYPGLETAHFEKMVARFDVARDYCAKDGPLVEFGICPITPKEKGVLEKNKWQTILMYAKAGRQDDLELEYPKIAIAHYRTFKLMAKDNLLAPQDLHEPVGIWIWGEPGVGKSYRARHEYPGAYLKMYNKWWDGYQGQDNVIMDEMELEGAFMGHLLKVWADEYSFITEAKGTAMVIRPKKFIITSNYSIDQVFQETEMNGAIHRRFKEIEMKKKWKWNGEQYQFTQDCVPRPPGHEDDPIIIDDEEVDEEIERIDRDGLAKTLDMLCGACECYPCDCMIMPEAQNKYCLGCGLKPFKCICP